MRKLEAITGLLERAQKHGATQIRVQLEEHFIVEATLSPIPVVQTQPKTTPSKETEEDNLAFYSS